MGDGTAVGALVTMALAGLFLDLVVTLVALLTLGVDWFLGALLVSKYYAEWSQVYMALTAGLVVVPGLASSLVAIRRLTKTEPRVPFELRCLRYVAVVGLVAPISPYADALYFLFKRYEALIRGEVVALQRATDLMDDALTGAGHLRLFHAVLGAAPQLGLQLYLTMQCSVPGIRCDYDALQLSSVVASTVSLAVAMTTYDRASRRLRHDVFRDSIYTALLFISHVCNILARIIPLVLVAFISVSYIWFVLGLHWNVMAFWLLLVVMTTGLFRWNKLVNSLTLATVYIWVFINYDSSRTCFKYLFYFMICLTENTALMVMWISYGSADLWFYYPFIISHYVMFVAGIGLLAVNHQLYHAKLLQQSHGEGQIDLNSDLCGQTDSV